MDQEIVEVTFTLPELWLLQTQIRHEQPEPAVWMWPPWNEKLNEQIALAIAYCCARGKPETNLHLDKGQLLAIDYMVKFDMKLALAEAGWALGYEVLKKVCLARRHLGRELWMDELEEATEIEDAGNADHRPDADAIAN